MPTADTPTLAEAARAALAAADPVGRAHRPRPRAGLRHRRGRRATCSPTPTTSATAPPR